MASVKSNFRTVITSAEKPKQGTKYIEFIVKLMLKLDSSTPSIKKQTKTNMYLTSILLTYQNTNIIKTIEINRWCNRY